MMNPIRTYSITVVGYPPVLYSARSPGKARARAWRDYSHAADCSFAEFLGRSTVRRVDDPPGIGSRIIVSGLPATRVIGNGGQYVAFMRDDGEDVLYSHPLDVSPAPDTGATQ